MASAASTVTVAQKGKRVVICGGGVIGASVAYYLSKRGVKPTVIDRCKVLCSASAKAGGFLARDWGGPFAAKSFDLHEQLSKELKNAQDYRRVDTWQVSLSNARLEAGLTEDAAWIDGVDKRVRVMGTPKSTAQVHPFKLTNALLKSASERGTRVHIGCIQGLVVERSGSSNTVTGVKVDGKVIPCDVCVLALGPWTGALATKWLCNSDTGLKTLGVTSTVGGDKYASITLQTPAEAKVSAHALFTDSHYDVEIYPRPDGEVYLCGCPERGAKLPEDPAAVQPKDSAVAAIKAVADQVSSVLATVKVTAKQACFLPTSADGGPIIGRLPQVQGVMVATAHSCWGILKAPATGLALSELIVDGKCKTFDLRPFDPSRR